MAVSARTYKCCGVREFLATTRPCQKTEGTCRCHAFDDTVLAVDFKAQGAHRWVIAANDADLNGQKKKRKKKIDR